MVRTSSSSLSYIAILALSRMEPTPSFSTFTLHPKITSLSTTHHNHYLFASGVPRSKAQQSEDIECVSENAIINSNERNDRSKDDGTEHKNGFVGYGLGGVDLSKRWLELVREGRVSAISSFRDDYDDDDADDDEEGVSVRYGVKLDDDRGLMEYAEILPSDDDDELIIPGRDDCNNETKKSSKTKRRIESIVKTLREIQQCDKSPSKKSHQSNGNKIAIQCVRDGPYAAQLQLVRTLRPPRSKNMETGNDAKESNNYVLKDGNRNTDHSACSNRRTSAALTATCTPPPYDPRNSFLVGPLRLYGHGKFHGDGEPRERMARLRVPRTEPNSDTVNELDIADGEEDRAIGTMDWDIYHNISPIDPRGHFLLLPCLERGYPSREYRVSKSMSCHMNNTLRDESNHNSDTSHYNTITGTTTTDASSSANTWRGQSLLSSDCRDITYLASTIHPPGSLMLSFNSVGAGASQNHIHCHGWVSPSPPFLVESDFNHDGDVNGSDDVASSFQPNNFHRYAVTGVAVDATNFSPLYLRHGTKISMLEYPCTCIKLSSVSSPLAIVEMGESLATIVKIAQGMKVPHNVAWTNTPPGMGCNEPYGERNEDSAPRLEIYIFFRSKSQTIIPDDGSGANTSGGDKVDNFRLGASEMLGLFHSSSKKQLELLSSWDGCMEQILRDVSWEPRRVLWEKVCNILK